MKKTVCIIGAGMGAGDMTREALDATASAEVLFGAPRLLELLEKGWPEKPSFPFYRPDEVRREIERSEKSRFAVLVSGDVGFFSGAAALREALRAYGPRLVPGVSCVNAFAARLGIPWQHFKFVSAHGADVNIVEQTRRHHCVLCLTGGNAAEIGARLDERGLGDVKVFAGENLGSEKESVTGMTARELRGASLAPLATLLLVNENHDSRVRFGLPDDAFARLDGVPMTKREARAVIASELRLSPGAVCYDIGAGTGSVTVEAALAAYDGHVFAIERNEKALSLIAENLTRFQIGNATVVRGEAPLAFAALPAPDAAFIGGSSGEMAGVIDALVKKNVNVRIVASVITLENAMIALTALEDAFENAEMLQLSVSRAKPIGSARDKRHMMTARNPVMILSGGGL